MKTLIIFQVKNCSHSSDQPLAVGKKAFPVFYLHRTFILSRKYESKFLFKIYCKAKPIWSRDHHLWMARLTLFVCTQLQLPINKLLVIKANFAPVTCCPKWFSFEQNMVCYSSLLNFVGFKHNSFID